mmetsp:Transcript_34361/g.61806  ORF Transcript_34361/g.61806 Transcript_34361/m.61806 type:complete len:245 (-) Transcript_34361:86-820(-)
MLVAGLQHFFELAAVSPAHRRAELRDELRGLLVLGGMLLQNPTEVLCCTQDLDGCGFPNQVPKSLEKDQGLVGSLLGRLHAAQQQLELRHLLEHQRLEAPGARGPGSGQGLFRLCQCLFLLPQRQKSPHHRASCSRDGSPSSRGQVLRQAPLGEAQRLPLQPQGEQGLDQDLQGCSRPTLVPLLLEAVHRQFRGFPGFLGLAVCKVGLRDPEQGLRLPELVAAVQVQHQRGLGSSQRLLVAAQS